MQRAGRFITEVLKKLKYTDEFVDKVKPVASTRDGAVQFELRLEKQHCDLHGTLHSGMAFALVDLYTWTTACTLYDQESPFVSLNLTARYLHHTASSSLPARLGDVILMDTRITHAGKKVAYVEMDIINKATKRLLVQGSHTIFVLSRRVLSAQ
ncbi:acyl-coenzyme A thioesterase 13-like [Dermacentor silvarum]|uniref:acyl-coenzyme A thioesterase 13-like n=1 Tax=Dermacentor silvarum TaxID=543639 RepID=UPI002100E706|nr:acyl-coenzyme A thioesterase 13-like [Dermacentor silvarum]